MFMHYENIIYMQYVCRKTLADRRVRVRGRFARNNDCEQQSPMSKTHNNHSEKDEDMFSGSDDYLIQVYIINSC